MANNGQVIEAQMSASDAGKVSQINDLLAGTTPDDKVKPLAESSDETNPQESNDSDSTTPDPELAFDTDQPPQDAEPKQTDAASADQSAQDEDEGEAKPVTLSDIAETLELDSKDLYEIEIPIGSGDEAVSLGTLKDSHKELLKLNASRASYDEHRTQSENELLVSRRQVAQLIHMGQSAGLLNDSILADIDNIHATNLQRERSALMSAIPEWSDPTTRDNDFNDIVEVLGEYGIQRNEIEQSIDSRLVKFVHDMTKRLKAVKAAKAAGKVPKSIRPGGRKGSSKTALQLKIEAAKNGSKVQKLDAVNAVLSGIK